ncbi:PoNe immunity protein domain-containing protein, partial [Defluviitalea phaphyphila]|uniref:PoNe immunity protein domain-containing protein n=1 Tax=Defluviitalea phaphyphila TaxID=1473580 RepID=UPI0011876DC3
MVRDKFKTFEHFEEEITFANQCIEERKEEIKLLKEDIKNGIQRYQRDNEEIIRMTYRHSTMYEFRKINAMYSAGMPIEDLVEDVKYAIFCIENYFEFEDYCSENEYLRVLWLISLGILLEIDKNNIKRLANIVEKWGIEDFVIDYLLCASDIGWERLSNVYYKEHPYSKVREIIELAEKDKNKAS